MNENARGYTSGKQAVRIQNVENNTDAYLSQTHKMLTLNGQTQIANADN